MKISTAGVASSGMPMISSITIMISRNTTLESVTDTSHSPRYFGIREYVIT